MKISENMYIGIKIVESSEAFCTSNGYLSCVNLPQSIKRFHATLDSNQLKTLITAIDLRENGDATWRDFAIFLGKSLSKPQKELAIQTFWGKNFEKSTHEALEEDGTDTDASETSIPLSEPEADTETGPGFLTFLKEFIEELNL